MTNLGVGKVLIGQDSGSDAVVAVTLEPESAEMEDAVLVDTGPSS